MINSKIKTTVVFGIITISFLTGCTTTVTMTPTATSTTTTPVVQPTTSIPIIITPTPTPDNLSRLWITNNNGEKITVMIEIPEEADFVHGLENRTILPENQGMLFQWQEDVTIAFQMWKTSLPLSIAFISSSGEILEIQDMEPFYPEVYEPSQAYRYALEVNQGFFTRNDIGIGNTVKFIS